MRTTIIPAQITTVEDKIAGSLSMMQILILVFPILFTALVYIFLPTPMKLNPYKIALVLTSVVICIGLVIRVKDKIIAQWLGVILKYYFRPKYFLYNKNDLTGRTVDVPPIPNIALYTKKPKQKVKATITPDPEVADLFKLQQLIDSGKVTVRYQFNKKL
jgi:glucan phosphoethanolaminetransferase (alkaline phosphatase superfamily)